MTVQPSGTAVLGTYAAVASAVIRLPKRWALAVIIPIIAIVDIASWQPRANASLVFAWTNIAYVFMFVIGHLLRLSEDHQIQAQALLEEEERTRLARNEAAALRRARPDRPRAARRPRPLALGASWSSRGRASWPSTATSTRRDRGHRPRPSPRSLRPRRGAGGDPGAARGLGPGPDKLEDLLEEMRAHGIECTLEISGEDAAAPLRSGRWRSSAPPRRRSPTCASTPRKRAVAIRLDYDPDGVQLIVADSHATVPNRGCRSRRRWRARLRLRVSGMRERAELIGGRLLAGPTEDGFRVELWVPA